MRSERGVNTHFPGALGNTDLELGVQGVPLEDFCARHSGISALCSTKVDDLNTVKLLHDGSESTACRGASSIPNCSEVSESDGNNAVERQRLTNDNL